MHRAFLFVLWAAPFAGAAQHQHSLQHMSDAFQALTRRVSPAVVKVLVTGYGPASSEEGGKTAVIRRQHAIGSGVIVDPNGYIITNAHVVEGAQAVKVVLRPAVGDLNPVAAVAHGRTLKAKIAGVDRRSDLAVLKVDAAGLPTLPIGDYRQVRQGEVVLAFGSPEGLDDSVTMGVVSSVARQPDPDQPMIFIQTDAAVNPGNSGGPLVDTAGHLIGINTFILSESGGSQGINFAIPSVIVRFVYDEILLHGHVHRRLLGLNLQALTPALAAGLGLPAERGLIAADVLPDGPAAKSGVEIGDILMAIDGAPVNSLPEYEAALYRAPHGEAVTLELARNARKLSLKVPVLEQQQHEVDDLAGLVDPGKNLVPALGILGIEVTGQIAAMLDDLRIGSGVLVAAKAADAAVETDLAPGDVIHALNGAPVESLEALRAALARLKPGDAVALQVERESRLLYMAFELD